MSAFVFDAPRDAVILIWCKQSNLDIVIELWVLAFVFDAYRDSVILTWNEQSYLDIIVELRVSAFVFMLAGMRLSWFLLALFICLVFFVLFVWFDWLTWLTWFTWLTWLILTDSKDSVTIFLISIPSHSLWFILSLIRLVCSKRSPQFDFSLTSCAIFVSVIRSAIYWESIAFGT